MGSVLLVARVLPAVSSSQGTCLTKPFCWLPLGVALDLGRAVSPAPSLGAPLASMGLFSSAGFLTRIRQHLEVDSSPKITAQGPPLQGEALFLLPFRCVLFLCVKAQEDNAP